jgi:putative hydrolase of the HAD superfamily
MAGAAVISLVLFDLDDTLFAHRRAVDEGIVAFSGRDDAAFWHELEEKHYHRYLAGELDFFEQRRARARDYVAPLELDDAAADAWFTDYFEEYRRAWTLHDDTLACLDALAPYQLGLITNGDLAFQSEKIAALGLSGRFSHVVASGEVGFAKPDPRIFTGACELFGTPASEAVYVGDRLQTDAIGAAAAGLTGVWLDRARGATDAELAVAATSGVRVIASLTALPALVAAL